MLYKSYGMVDGKGIGVLNAGRIILIPVKRNHLIRIFIYRTIIHILFKDDLYTISKTKIDFWENLSYDMQFNIGRVVNLIGFPVRFFKGRYNFPNLLMEDYPTADIRCSSIRSYLNNINAIGIFCGIELNIRG